VAKKETPAPPVATFSKQQILAAKKYAERRDVLSVLLAEDKSYELADVDKLIEDFMKKEFDKSKEGD